MKYRAEIDGLRALAVVPVIFFHAGFELFGGGFVGVDVFFVVSGYLITTILTEDLENHRYSIVNFYERRARRILPALFLVMLVCIPFAWMWMMPSQMKDFSESIAAVTLFASNILFWQESGYFAAAAEEKPLLHTWSLAVEEQYYVLFPIFLLLAWRYGKNRVFWMIVVFAAISLGLSEWAARNTAGSGNFYLAPTRAWELFAGSMAAFVVQKRGVQANNLFSLLGLAAILFAVFVYDESTPFPGLYALVPVVGVVLVVIFAEKETITARMLSTKLFVGIGLISYSAYLWHQPLFAFARLATPEKPSGIIFFLLSLLSFLLAIASWKLVEQPFRNKILVSRNFIFTMVPIFAVTFTVAGLSGHKYSENYEDYWLSRQTPEFRAAYNLITDNEASKSNFGADAEGNQLLGDCRFNTRELDDDVEKTLIRCSEQYGGGILVLGDSHAIDLFGVVASRFEEPFLIGFTRSGCRPHSNFDYCHYNRAADFLEKNNRVFRKVIYEQAGFYLLQHLDGTKGSRTMFSDLSISQSVENVIPDIEHITGTLRYLERINNYTPIIWFLPRAEPHIPTNYILKSGCDASYTFRPNLYETFEYLDSVISYTVEASGNNNIETVSQNQLFDFDLAEDFIDCKSFYWSDGDHYSADGEKRFGARLPPDFLE